MRTQAQAQNSKAGKYKRIASALVLAVLVCALLALVGCGSSSSNSSSGQTSSTKANFHNADIGTGAKPTESMALEYAKEFTVDRFEGGMSLICISDGSRYLVVPEGVSTPAGLSSDISVIKQGTSGVYLVATDSICLVDALGANGNIALSGIKAADCAVEGYRKALEAGTIKYGGKYSAPDYDLILKEKCPLAIESTMINHVPEVREQLQKLGTTVLTEQSSYEASPLGRVEWIKLYGVLFGKEDRAKEVFDAQMDQVRKVQELSKQEGGTPKKVAFFYINANGAAVARQPGDYVSQMIGLAGGTYALEGMSNDSAKATITMEMEKFYAATKDADIIIYNSSIDNGVTSIAELVGKNKLLSEFKAVKDGQVWTTQQNMYQQMVHTGDIISDFHAAFTDDTSDDKDIKFLERIQ